MGLIRRGFVIFFHFSGYDEIVTRVQTGPFFARPPPFDIKKSQQCRIVALPAAKSWKIRREACRAAECFTQLLSSRESGHDKS